jgi:hypothetical protein
MSEKSEINIFDLLPFIASVLKRVAVNDNFPDQYLGLSWDTRESSHLVVVDLEGVDSIDLRHCFTVEADTCPQTLHITASFSIDDKTALSCGVKWLAVAEYVLIDDLSYFNREHHKP